MEELSAEEKKKYQDAQSRLTDEQKEKLTATVDSLEEEAMEAGEKQDWKKLRSIYKKALKAYRTLTGGEDPAWYDGEDPYAEMVKEEAGFDSPLPGYAEKRAKLSEEEIKKMWQELDEEEELAYKLQEEGKYDEIKKLDKISLEKYRILTGGYNPEWYLGEINESDEFSGEPMDDVTEEQVEDGIQEEIVEDDELKEILTDSADLDEKVADQIIEELPEDKEEYSMVDVVKATVSAEIETSDALAVIDAIATQAVEDAGEAVNESAKTKIKNKIVEGLKRKYKKNVFESRYLRKKNK